MKIDRTKSAPQVGQRFDKVNDVGTVIGQIELVEVDDHEVRVRIRKDAAWPMRACMHWRMTRERFARESYYQPIAG